MNRDQVIGILQQHRDEIRNKFAVRRLLLFGSVARGEAGVASDVDLLVAFAGPATFDGYMELKFHLEGLLGCHVDLVTNAALKPRMRPLVAREAVRVA